MYLLYSLVLSLLFVALLPYFIYKAARRGKYSGSFKERLGLLPASLRADSGETIWVHAVSVGEFLAARPLIAQLRSHFSAARIVVSTTTLTGQQLARSQPHLFDAVLYFPFDWKFSVRSSLNTIKPSAVIIMETELWPNFLGECRRRGIVTVLANGRISARSFRRYRLLGRPFRRAIENLSLMVMQSEADADRARQLGAPANRVRVCGNLKYDQPRAGSWGPGVRKGTKDFSDPQSPSPIPPCEIDQLFGLSLTPHLIVAGSTAPGEEEMLLASLREIRKHEGLEDARLLLAPRHPERFDEVARLIARSGFAFVRRSESRGSSGSSAPCSGSADHRLPQAAGAPAHAAPDVLLLDTLGELASIYRFAAVVFVGGSLVPRGGHNIIEPAAYAKPVIVGPHTENFRQIVSDFALADALIQIGATGNDPVDELTQELSRLLSESEHARAMGERGRDILLKNRGATDCTVAMIREVVKV